MSTMKKRPYRDALNRAVGIFRNALNRVVDIFRNPLSRRPEDSPQNPEAPNTPPPTPSADQSSYRLNKGSTPALLHKGDSVCVKVWAPDSLKNWPEYPTKDAARRSISRQTRECRLCF